MKKISLVLLIAVLGAGFVFAGFSGSAQVGFGANFDNGEWGFIDNGTNVSFNFDFASAKGEKKGEGDIYAEIAGSLKLFAKTGAFGMDEYDDALLAFADSPNGKLLLAATIDKAKIAGKDWYVSLLGVPNGPNFAKSAIDTWTVTGPNPFNYGLLGYKMKKAASYAVPYEKAPGVEASYKDFVVGVGLKAKAVKTPSFKPADKLFSSVYFATPDFAVAEGFKVKAAAAYSKSEVDAAAPAPAPFGRKGNNAFGASVKASYETDKLKASVATDTGYNINAKQFDADVAANFAFAPVTVDVYFATNVKVNGVATKNLLSAQLVTDLAKFEVPVKLTVSAKDIINLQDLGVEAEVAVMKELTLTANGGFGLKTKVWNAGLSAEYKAENFTAKAGASVEKTLKTDNMVLGASASIESEKVINGAKVSLAWSDANDLLKKDATVAKKLGKVVATVSVEF